jgi:hypothetical protein
MRGQPWEYLWQWALPTLAILVTVWLLGQLLGCLHNQIKHKTSKRSQTCRRVLGMTVGFLKESALILIHLLTINEVALYASASFKIIIFGGVEI